MTLTYFWSSTIGQPINEARDMVNIEKSIRKALPHFPGRILSLPVLDSLDVNEGSDHIGEVDAISDGVKYQHDDASGNSTGVDAKLASAIPVEQPQPQRASVVPISGS